MLDLALEDRVGLDAERGVQDVAFDARAGLKFNAAGTDGAKNFTLYLHCFGFHLAHDFAGLANRDVTGCHISFDGPINVKRAFGDDGAFDFHERCPARFALLRDMSAIAACVCVLSLSLLLVNMFTRLQKFYWIIGFVVEPHFIVEVWAGASAG